MEVDNPERFENLKKEQKEVLCNWIKENFVKRKTVNYNYTSYGLKHYFEGSPSGFYVDNGEFKGAMLFCGFTPMAVDSNERNWKFRFSIWKKIRPAG